ncbi:hypothetical protein TNCV_3035771 [Trichonephila clavipes]|nr:hypothetical protein TNCV_3035771 [Trichonephila clavipes]
MALIPLSIVIELHFGVVCLIHQEKEDDTLTSPEITPFFVPPETERERKVTPKRKTQCGCQFLKAYCRTTRFRLSGLTTVRFSTTIEKH